ncbi:MAG: DUF2334 domain-containing protein [Acidobacteriota bacterium]
MSGQDLYVVLHDVAPPNASAVRSLLEMLEPFDVPVHAGVVPRWRAVEDAQTSHAWDSSSRRLLDDFDAALVHGWTHRRRRGRWWSPVSWATDGADELAGLGRSELAARLEVALADTRRLTGREPVGLLPPAWRLPRRAETVAFELGYPRVVRFDAVEEPAQRYGLTTWSWDWGWAGRPATGLLEALSEARSALREEARCLALHPADVCRGLLPRIRRCLEQRLEAGDVPKLLGATA